MCSIGHNPYKNHKRREINYRHHGQHVNKSANVAIFMTATITIVVTNFSLQKKVDLMAYTVFFCILVVVTIVINIATLLFLTFRYIHWVHVLYSAISAIAFTLFLARDTQLLLGNKTSAVTLMGYIYAVISIFTDIIFIFFYIYSLAVGIRD
nr:protein lifeguard 3-like isoform X2 [Pogona vitticeps]